jgi:hypothetical protein
MRENRLLIRLFQRLRSHTYSRQKKTDSENVPGGCRKRAADASNILERVLGPVNPNRPSVQRHCIRSRQSAFLALKSTAFLARHRMRLDQFDARVLSALRADKRTGRHWRQRLHASLPSKGCPSHHYRSLIERSRCGLRGRPQRAAAISMIAVRSSRARQLKTMQPRSACGGRAKGWPDSREGSPPMPKGQQNSGQPASVKATGESNQTAAGPRTDTVELSWLSPETDLSWPVSGNGFQMAQLPGSWLPDLVISIWGSSSAWPYHFRGPK